MSDSGVGAMRHHDCCQQIADSGTIVLSLCAILWSLLSRCATDGRRGHARLGSWLTK